LQRKTANPHPTYHGHSQAVLIPFAAPPDIETITVRSNQTSLLVRLGFHKKLRMSDLHTNLTLPSDPSQVAKVEPFVHSVAERYQLSPDTHGNILVSLTEAVTNAMLHGNRGDCNKSVSISLQRQKDALSISVSDEGPGFDPRQVPDPTAMDCLEKCGGRGLFLMRHLSDECRFKRGGSTVEMRFNLG
jgi:serine/threonine-protein kinase RsbW